MHVVAKPPVPGIQQVADYKRIEIGTDDGRAVAIDSPDDVLLVAGAKVLKMQARYGSRKILEVNLVLVFKAVSGDGVYSHPECLQADFTALGSGYDNFLDFRGR